MEQLADNPSSVVLMNSLAHNHNKLGNYENCIKWVDQALAQIPNHVPATRYKISCLRTLDKNDLATHLKTERKQYARERHNELVAESKQQKKAGLARKRWWIYSSPFATGPGFPRHVNRNNISGCASVKYRITEHGKIKNLQISNEYP